MGSKSRLGFRKGDIHWNPSDLDKRELRRVERTRKGVTGAGRVLWPRKQRKPRPGELRELKVRGAAGAFATLANGDRSLGRAFGRTYDVLGWRGVLSVLYDLRRELTVRRAVDEVALFQELGWDMEWCKYKGHWYVRRARGRRPEACFLHAVAARQARFRQSPRYLQRRSGDGKRGI